LKDSGVAEVTKLIDDAPFPIKYINPRGRQTGYNYNIIDGYQTMFETYDYDKIIVVEDDNLQASNSLKICINLSDYFEQFNNIGFTFSCSPCYLTLDEKKQRLNEVFVPRDYRFKADCTLYKKAWLSIRDIMVNYKKYVSSGGNLFVNVTELIEYLNDAVKHREHIVDNVFPVTATPIYLESPPNGCLNDDCLLQLLLAVKGYSVLSTTVNFVRIIGEIGINFDQNVFKNCGLAATVLDEIPEFSDVKEFVLVPS
jgi:hypothetical protein